MAKTNEEKLHKINEQIAHNYEKINKAKEEIKALKVLIIIQKWLKTQIINYP